MGLVDLAGKEQVASTGVVGVHFSLLSGMLTRKSLKVSRTAALATEPCKNMLSETDAEE